MKSGDTVRVHVKVREGDKERIQIFEGIVIGLHRGGVRASFTVRKVSFGQGVERIFPLHSPTIAKVDLVRSARVRRAKLYFLRELKGKAARMKETKKRLETPRDWDSRMVRVRAMRTLENAMRRWGFYRVAGCDEVGRGCLAGPVVAGAVILDPARHIPGLADSKTVTALERERLYDLITRKALAWSVAAVQPTEIDELNIHRASLEAMRRAVMAIAPLPDMIIVDAFRIPDLLIAQRGVPKGDRRCSAIAAASIVAKVTRDREMLVHHASDPRYGYAITRVRDGRAPGGRCALRILTIASPIVQTAEQPV